jgi:hypothetical protein
MLGSYGDLSERTSKNNGSHIDQEKQHNETMKEFFLPRLADDQHQMADGKISVGLNLPG